MALSTSELLWNWLKIIVALPIVLLLAYVSLKLSKGYVNTLRKGLYMKVIETVPVFNKTALSIVQIGKKYLVLGVSDQGIQVVSELTDDEVTELLAKNQEAKINTKAFSHFIEMIKDRKDRRQKER